ncbi:MAG: putative hydrophobic protein (TIGR00271 family), partial [Crocinitomicaceae bacterium]
GLNMNSTAVVIGAMLISPLMGPINGIGYSIATYNFDLLKSSLKNYAFSALAGLVASTLYFLITPIHTEHSELLSRTSPTIYDVFIAMFGGLAGIVAITSKNKGNVLPGVAIATALMPPLCTAGYGISVGNSTYFIGAMYLFLINTVFIALASMLVSQIMKFPKKSFLLSKEIKNTNIVVGIVILLTVVPSVYLGITLVEKEKFSQLANQYVKKVNIWDGNFLLDEEINADERTITLIYGGSEFDSLSKVNLLNKADDMGLEAKIRVEQGLKIRNYDDIASQDDKFTQLNAKVSQLQLFLHERDSQIDSIKTIPYKGLELLSEISVLYPQIIACTYAESDHYIDSLESSVPVSLVFFTLDDKLTTKESDGIQNWVKKRLRKDHVIVKF